MKKLFAAFAVVALLVGCGGQAPTPQERTVSAMTEIIAKKTQYIREGKPAGMGIGISTDETIAYEKADQNARVDLAKEIDAQVKALTKNFKEQINVEGMESVAEHFSNTAKTVVDVNLTGATLMDVKIETVEGKFKVYGVMPLNTVLIEEYFKSVENTDNKLSEEQKQVIRDLAKKAYDELDIEVPAEK